MAVVSTIQFVAALQSSSRELIESGYKVTIPQVYLGFAAERFFSIDFGAITVRWNKGRVEKIQRNIGHFLELVEYISIAVSYKRKKITV